MPALNPFRRRLLKWPAAAFASLLQQFDAHKTASLELEWWNIHRERAGHALRDLEVALAELQSSIYGNPAGEFAVHAKARADAMAIRDDAGAPGGPTEDEWRQIGELLDRSWMSVAQRCNALTN